ncbi:MAG TPA: hypothetical protein VGH11_04790 [Jatrophihabitans sp.]|jgi:hypothetical protein
MTASARGRRDNGLASEAFSPVADVDPRLADHLLDVLGLREVPAYVEPAPATGPVTADRLYVATQQTGEARAVLTQIAAELGIEVSQHDRYPGQDPAADLLADLDTDAEFAAIVASLEDLDRTLIDLEAATPATTVSLSKAASAKDDEVEHFVPPTPPPVPKPTKATAMAVLVTVLGVAVIAFGGMIGLPGNLPLPLGVILVLFGTVMLILRLRPEPWDDSDDDGAVV